MELNTATAYIKQYLVLAIYVLEIERNGEITMSKDQKVWLVTGSHSGFGRSLANTALAKVVCFVTTASHTEELKRDWE